MQENLAQKPAEGPHQKVKRFQPCSQEIKDAGIQEILRFTDEIDFIKISAKVYAIGTHFFDKDHNCSKLSSQALLQRISNPGYSPFRTEAKAQYDRTPTNANHRISGA